MNYKEKLKFIFRYYGLRKQLTKLFEELGEVMIEVSKFMLGNGNRQHLGGEIADVLVMTEQIIWALGLDAYVQEQKEYKVDRQIERITGEGKDEH